MVLIIKDTFACFIPAGVGRRGEFILNIAFSQRDTYYKIDLRASPAIGTMDSINKETFLFVIWGEGEILVIKYSILST